MNAVNLIPSQRRGSGGPTSLVDSAPFLAVVLVLVLALLGTFLFVSGQDRVSSRRAELARVQTSSQRWQTAAAGFSQDVTELKNRSTQIQTVRSLAGTRYDWSLLLGQLAGLMPKDTSLQSMSASSGSSASSSSSSSSSTSASTTTATASGISIAACATSQTSVAAAMVAFRRIVGVTDVSLSTSSKGSGGGDCGVKLPVSFQVSLTFTPPTEGSSSQTTSATPAEAAAPSTSSTSTTSSSEASQ